RSKRDWSSDVCSSDLYIDLYFKHDVYQQSDGSVIAKAYREGILEDNTYNCYEYKSQELWKDVTVPTLLLRAGQGLFTDNDQLLSDRKSTRLNSSHVSI